jgi:transcriptional regulator with XRE-family HTH domain
MDLEILQKNLLKLMQIKGFTMKGLSLAANLNETAVRDILKGRVINPTYKTLEKLATILGSSVRELTENPLGGEEITVNPVKLTEISRELFIQSIVKVDELIKRNNIQLTAEERAKIYVAWYELLILNRQGASNVSPDPELKNFLKRS